MPCDVSTRTGVESRGWGSGHLRVDARSVRRAAWRTVRARVADRADVRRGHGARTVAHRVVRTLGVTRADADHLRLAPVPRLEPNRVHARVAAHVLQHDVEGATLLEPK